jgi:hypothetical protein
MQQHRYRFALLCVLAGFLSTVLHPSPMWARSNVVKLQGQGASAHFFSGDSSGCIATDVFVQFGQFATSSPPKEPGEVWVATMFISQFDYCTGTQLLLAFPQGDIPLPTQAAQISRKLDSAFLSATVELLDVVSGQNISPQVELMWTATNDPPNRTHSHFHFHGSGSVANFRSKSISRTAQVNGSVLLNSINITPQPTMGTLESARSGEVFIFHP